MKPKFNQDAVDENLEGYRPYSPPVVSPTPDAPVSVVKSVEQIDKPSLTAVIAKYVATATAGAGVGFGGHNVVQPPAPPPAPVVNVQPATPATDYSKYSLEGKLPDGTTVSFGKVGDLPVKGK